MMFGGDRTALADACRRAGLTFMEGVAAGWSRRDLGLWLVGPYREVTVSSAASQNAQGSGEVDAASISDVLRETRWAVFAALEDAMHGQTKFVQMLARQRLIMKDAVKGWIALDVPGARLRSRVLSLFAIDQLTRPGDYHHSLLACSRCEGIVFDEALRRDGHGCARSAAGTMPGPSTGLRSRTSDFVARVTPGEIRIPSQSKLPSTKPGSGNLG